MIQIVEFKERYGKNDNAIHGANKWLEEHREYRIIDIKYQTITDEGGDRTSILIVYDNFVLPPAKALKECADQLKKMKTDNFFRCFDFIVYALKAGKIHKFCYQNNYLRKALFELSEQGYICFCYTESLKHKFVILDKEIFNEVFLQ